MFYGVASSIHSSSFLSGLRSTMACSSSAVYLIFDKINKKDESTDSSQQSWLIFCLPEEVLKVADETVNISLAGRLVNYVFVVVVAQSARQLLIIHLGFVLPDTPASSHLIRIGQLKLPAIARPRDEALARLVRKQFQQKLPKLDGAGTGEARTAPWWTSCKKGRKDLVENREPKIRRNERFYLDRRPAWRLE